VGEVQFSEWTAGGHVRHPSFLGFRADQQARDVVRELPSRISSSSQPQLPRRCTRAARDHARSRPRRWRA
jgi:bifunctional non-homologous end joining protein LigD